MLLAVREVADRRRRREPSLLLLDRVLHLLGPRLAGREPLAQARALLEGDRRRPTRGRASRPVPSTVPCRYAPAGPRRGLASSSACRAARASARRAAAAASGSRSAYGSSGPASFDATASFAPPTLSLTASLASPTLSTTASLASPTLSVTASLTFLNRSTGMSGSSSIPDPPAIDRDATYPAPGPTGRCRGALRWAAPPGRGSSPRMFSSCWRAAICWANRVAWMPWNRPSSQPTSWAWAMRSSISVGVPSPANGKASRSSSSRRSGDSAEPSSRIEVS